MKSEKIKSQKPAKKRTFSVKDEKLDKLYREINDSFSLSKLSRPFLYEFNEEKKTHVMLVNDFLRFSKAMDSPVIVTEFFDKESGNFKKITPERIGDFYNYYYDYSNNHSNNSYNHLNKSRISQSSPIFWPIKSATNESLKSSVNNIIYNITNKKIEEFLRLHPEYRGPKIEGEPNLNHKKLMQVRLVLDKKLLSLHNLLSRTNFCTATKNWWQYFIDRDVMKTLISVVGNKKSSKISWLDYAGFTQIPNLETTIDNINSLGVERQLLTFLPFIEWQNKKPSHLLKENWLKVWPEVAKLPKSVQNQISSHILLENEYPNTEFELLYSSLPQIAQKNKFTPISNSKKEEYLWDVFSYIKSAGNWKPRELLMLWFFSVNSVKCLRNNSLIKDTNELKQISKEVFIEFSKIWRIKNPKEYANWSGVSINQWTGESFEILIKSLEEKSVSFPEEGFNCAKMKIYKSMYINNCINKEVAPIKKSKIKTKKLI